MGSRIHFANYSPAADIVVTAICFVMIVLVGFSYISRTRSIKLFLTMVGLVLVAAWTDMAFYSLVTMPNIYVVANWVRCIYHGCLFLIFVYYIAYICEVTHYENQQRSLFLANVVFAIVMLADIITTAQGLTFAVGEAGMERIMELPFDIIKFDRSLVIASETEDRSRKMVAKLANMFTDMNYCVLYEGVEKDAEEEMCKDMSATYLQGYKYSKPAPIVDLKEYISRKQMG